MKTRGEIKSTDNDQFVYVLNGSTSKSYPTLDSIQKRFPLAAVEGVEPVEESTEDVDQVEKPKKAKKGKK